MISKPPETQMIREGVNTNNKFNMPTYDFSKITDFISNIITPYGYVTETQKSTITIGWVILLGTIWTFSTMTFLPTPVAVWDEISRMIEQESLIAEVITSLKLCFVSMIFGTLLSMLITYINPIALLNPISEGYTKLRYLSISGLSFFFTLLASSDSLKIYLLMFSLSVFFVTSFNEAIAMPECDYIHARTLGLSKWQTLWENVIVGKRDKLIKIMAQTFAILWIMLPSVELLVRSSGGIGVLLTVEAKYFKLAGIVGIIIIIVGIGIIIDFLFGILRVWVSPYAKYENK